MSSDAIGISNLLGIIKEAVGEIFSQSLWLTAEVLHTSGGHHTYLELVEYDEARVELAKCSGVIWASDKSILSGFEKVTSNKLGSGMKILFKARPSFHPIHGLSLRIEKIDPTFTLGDMEQKIERMRLLLKEKGWWDRNLSLPKPKDFTRVAVISPHDAAGLGDFRVEADRLTASDLCEFEYFPATFQGKDAGDSIVARMIDVNQAHGLRPYDALVIIRGGGDKAGLYHLNHAKLAAAVCRFPVPVLVGIGHERDRVLIDEVACLRFATPSLVITAIRNQIVQNAYNAHDNWGRIRLKGSALLDSAEYHCKQKINQMSAYAENSLTRAGSLLEAEQVSLRSNASLALQNAQQALSTKLQEVKNRTSLHCLHHDHALGSLKEQLSQVAIKQLDHAQSLCETHMSSVMSANPLSVLGRGYAYVHVGDRIVTSRSQVARGDLLKITMKDGTIQAAVEDL